MEENLQIEILDALYERFQSHPDSPEMTFTELYKAIGVPFDQKTRGRVQRQLFSLRKKEWVEYESLPYGQGGEASITPKGIRVAEDNQQMMASASEVDNLGICPATLGDITQRDSSCACLIQRDELVNEVLEYLSQPSKTYHFILLYGEPMVGKTILLKHISERLDEKCVPLLVTVQGSLLNKALGDLDAFVFDLAQQLTDRFGEWAERHGLPKLNSPDRNGFEGKGTIAFDTHWADLRSMAGKREPVVMFDEIESLLDPHEKLDLRILTFLYHFVCNPDNGCFILVGSEFAKRYSELARRYSEFPQYDTRIEQFDRLISRGHSFRVRYYDDEIVKRIFSVTQKYFAYEGDTLEYIAALCDGHPRILDVMLQAIVRLIRRSRGKQGVEKSDIEAILTSVVDRASYFLWWMCQRLNDTELHVVWLVSQKILISPIDALEYSVRELVGLANQHFADSTIDYSILIEKGVTDLESREWIEWKDRDDGLFRFKLGIFPVWIGRHQFSLDEVRHL